jgi:AhpD family alkylhydroperoxidase
MKLEVFDPAMCCSTGVCGTNPDPALARFAADLEWLNGQGTQVERFNLSQQPGTFAERELVRAALTEGGETVLPVILLEGRAVSQGRYPSRQELASWVNLTTKESESVFTAAVAELVAIGAAIASNCEPCFKFHYDQARKLGVSVADMKHAVVVAEGVKETPARKVSELAARYLGIPIAEAACGCGDESGAQLIQVSTTTSGSSKKCC